MSIVSIIALSYAVPRFSYTCNGRPSGSTHALISTRSFIMRSLEVRDYFRERDIPAVKLRAYQAFCAAIETGSISAAARRLYLAQPTVTERIAELERESKVPLLERSKRGVVPTAEGRSLYERARELLAEVETLESTLELALKDLRERNDLKLRFAAGVVCGEYLLSKWLRSFERDMPGVIPEIFIGADPDVMRKVGAGEAPLGVVADESCYDLFDCVTVFHDELVLVVRSDHPWANQEIPVARLASEPFISRERQSSMSTFTERLLRNLGAPPLRVHLELRNITAMKEAVEAGLGFSILPKAAIKRKLETGVLAEVRGFSMPWDYKLIRNRSVPLSRAEDRFREFLISAQQ